ncbi:MAG: hypothetical protein IAE93_00545 [Ignavibacteria bacterium]|nr:hypothetical protein [Ignavibacteria bacterium]
MIKYGNPIGSEWNKWDLHVHTPVSVEQHYGDSQQQEIWDKYFLDLEALPPEFKAIGINDYFSLEGYRKVLKAKQNGRLQNIELILPVIELRFKMFAGNKKTQRINYHVIFSNELTPDEIEANFLSKLSITYNLKQDNSRPFTVMGCSHQSLSQLGQAIIESTPHNKRSTDSSLRVGFANALYSEEAIQKLCEQTFFDKKIITAIGISEWDDMRFDGGGAGIKRSVINNTNLVFVASPNVSSYQNRLNQLIENEVNSCLLDCSDAHYFSNSSESMRLGNAFSWLNADLTFEGLRRAVRRFEDRIHVADIGKEPEKLIAIHKKKGKFIKRIEIRKKVGSTLKEKWFDCEIPFNAGLVAIIGNQGSGKSALTDIVALCGNSKTSHFSFLSPDKFRNRENKASEFIATLYWADGTKTKRYLNENVPSTEVERVTYVPQHFFDIITNETAVNQQSQFYKEIKKVIFSHISQSDRMECNDLDQLVEWRTKETEYTLTALREDLSRLNKKIFRVEEQVTPSSLVSLDKQITAKKQEISTHQTTKPQVVQEPANSAVTNRQIDELRQQEIDITAKLDAAREALTAWKTRGEIIKQKRQAAENEHRRMHNLIIEWQQEFDSKGIDLKAEDIISINIDWSLFDNEEKKISDKIAHTEQLLNEEIQGSLAQRQREFNSQRQKLESVLEENNKAYQQYLTNVQKWENRQKALIGDQKTTDSLEWLNHKKYEATNELPKQLETLYTKRQNKVKEIHGQLWKLAAIYRELTEDVREYIAADELTRDRYRLQFDIQIVEQGFGEQFFLRVKHRGSFSGKDEGTSLVATLIKKQDFNSADDTVQFTESILSKLKNDSSQNLTSDDVNQMVRVNKGVTELYDYIFGLEYLDPQYTISLNEKPLKMLSPGERGVLLLVFYLLIDQGDNPLIIDQPEGNLNNQAIVRDLVPVFKAAKKRRQIIMVTHNPNLAVVSDAEQIIHAHIDFQDENKVYFESGAMENPIFNDLMIDVLEGTRFAFLTRHDTYYTLSK